MEIIGLLFVFVLGLVLTVKGLVVLWLGGAFQSFWKCFPIGLVYLLPGIFCLYIVFSRVHISIV